ncbi:MAG: SGNH/GDSL hydrolase family protein [Chthoniobacteraceae bacterium]
MKSIPTLLVAALITAIVPLRADLVLKPNDMVAICGDSITEQRLYSAYMEEYFLMCRPAEGLRAAQFGWVGETTGGFAARIESDILPFKPTVVTTCYGMNDGAYKAMTPHTGDVFRQATTTFVEKMKAGGVRAILLGSPGCVDSTAFWRPGATADEYNKTLVALSDIAKEVATKEGVTFVDMHTPMMDVMTKAKAAYGANYQFVTGIGVHPAGNGQIVMAYVFLKALGCDGAIGTITVDLAGGTATGTPGQKIVSCQNGTVEVESTRYPFCFQGVPGKPGQAEGNVLGFFPFNDDLNRYLLVVKGIKGAKAKVTWGTVTKEFPAADLAKGVNLAAEFLVNPFCSQFRKVDAAVQAQQAQESLFIRSLLHNVAMFKTIAPNSGAELDKVAADGMAQETNLFTAAAALVVPVDHTIKIEQEP